MVVVTDSACTCIQDFDDGLGALDVEGDVLVPAVVHEVHVDAQPVLQSTVGFGFAPARLVRVILGAEPECQPPRADVASERGRIWGTGWEETRGKDGEVGEAN